MLRVWPGCPDPTSLPLDPESRLLPCSSGIPPFPRDLGRRFANRDQGLRVSMTSPALMPPLALALREARNLDGGWGYYAGKSSRLEPTCWALLALGGEADVEVLQKWPSTKDGLLLERAGENRT